MSPLTTDGPADSGYVLEAIVGGVRMWLVPPQAGMRYTFTHALVHACRWKQLHEAQTTRGCVWCGYFDPAWKRVSPEDTLRVRWLDDAYCAEVARAIVPAAEDVPRPT